MEQKLEEIADAIRDMDTSLGYIPSPAPAWTWIWADSGPDGRVATGVMINCHAVIGVHARVDDDELVGHVVEILCAAGPVRVWNSGMSPEADGAERMMEVCAKVCARLGLPCPGEKAG